MLATLIEKKLVGPGIATLAGLALLVSLGVWQLERRTWKEGLIAAIAARIKAPPVSLAEAAETLSAGGDIEYLRVAVRGRFLHDRERYLYAPDPALGPGFHVYTPLEAAGGAGIVLVNRGYVPEALKFPDARKAGQVEGEVEVTGLLRAPGRRGRFTPNNKPEENLWYWRDFDALLRSAAGEEARPALAAFLEAEAPAPGGWPKGGATRLDLPNRHLEYALTWFGLAAALAAVFTVFAYGRLRSEK